MFMSDASCLCLKGEMDSFVFCTYLWCEHVLNMWVVIRQETLQMLLQVL